ncbi:glycosyltransferase [Flavobacterium sp. HJJ]|uniref:glycosyltransferase n=1 Tax=Flavobacterium sp. HJJ TaxID=2783792 RepID=UPI001889F2CB|nr:glycosyltransferase [Flavobacterium sp. HJJ]MBF4470269.1 glycosyltransferase [Flavobacterium sp. HJJ]
MGISAFLPVYNEENRIKYAIESLLWCDEIILIDKNSTDKTVEIALSYGEKVKVHYMQNTEAYQSSEWDFFLNHCSNEWIIPFTASNVIHPKLAEKIIEIIRDKDSIYDIINIPFRRYVLGLESKRSPWYSKLSPKIVRKGAVVINKNGVHDAANFIGNQLDMENDEVCCMYHLTHETVDKMMSNHIRYWKGEMNSPNLTLNKSILNIIKGILKIFFIRKTFLMGKDGLMLMFAYLTYFMMSYVYKWEKEKGNAVNEYFDIRNNILNSWKKTNEI